MNMSYPGCSSHSLPAYMTSHHLEMRTRSDAKPCLIKGGGSGNLKVTLYVVPTCVTSFAILLTLQECMKYFEGTNFAILGTTDHNIAFLQVP